MDLTTDEMKTETFKVLGTRPIRHDGADKVTGKAKYANDIQLSGMVSGKVLRSPHAHAHIRSIDTSEAEKMPGVLAVVCGADFPDVPDKIAHLGEGSVVLSHLSNNVMAKEKVLYKGHAVAAVAASSPRVAEEALKRIRVNYEPLPAVTWVLDAMKETAPLLHEDLRTEEMGKKADKPSNVALHAFFEHGDIEKGFAEADFVIEREFISASVHQGYIEPQATVADWGSDNHVRIWTATQGSFTCRQQTAEVLQIPVSKVTVTPCEIGGGFGGKISIYLEPVAAVLSRKCGRPVKLVMQRDEVFEGTGPTPGSFIRLKLGVTKDGKLTSGEAWLAYDAGAYPGGMVTPGCLCVFSCYDLPNFRVNGYDVVLNKPHTKAYRAPGATQAAFACESVIDELVAELKTDPIKFRLNNAAREGTRQVDGSLYPRVGLVECLEALAESEHWKQPLEGANRGRGVAVGFWFGVGFRSSATATVNEDGSVKLVEGSTDIGGSRISLAMQLAECLGLSSDDVVAEIANTDNVGLTDVTGGSRVTFATGLAAINAGKDIVRQLSERFAKFEECDPAEVEFADGVFRRNGSSIAFKELAAKVSKSGEPVVGRATVAPAEGTNGFAAHIVDLEVDPETGKVTILRYTAAQDAGRSVHPSYVEGQIQGGVVQGIGWALNEEYVFDEQGRMTNPSYLDYRMPTMPDVPMIDTLVVEAPNPDHPYGVRGVGEPPIVPPPPAIANAIWRATGARLRELPMPPQKVWKAISQIK